MSLTSEELDIVLRLLAAKLPGVVRSLGEGGNGWRQILTIACWLLTACLNRHPEYADNVTELMEALPPYYATAEVAVAQEHPATVSQLIDKDVAWILIPGVDKPQAITN
jgi:hypothetical protein